MKATRALSSRALLLLSVALALQCLVNLGGLEAAGQQAGFRVYQNDKPLQEFPTRSQAIAYAVYYEYSHVERVGSREWLWDNYPRYVVYQEGVSKPAWAYRTYAEALAQARTMKEVHIRDVEQPGWVYSYYTSYQLYQGDKTYPEWGFATLSEAKQEAAKWTNAHIMDKAANRWVWDNLSAADKEMQRTGAPAYELWLQGQPTGEAFSFLYDAIAASNAQKDSTVRHTKSGRIVHSSSAPYRVLQSGRELRSFFSLANAVVYAQDFAYAQVVKDGRAYWTNVPYLQVKQDGRSVGYYHSKASALKQAAALSSAVVINADGRRLWSNEHQLLIAGWHGSSAATTITDQLARTQGLDISSPSWFELAAADGSLKDSSDARLVQQLKAQGLQVMPLVHNQFDAKLTSAFLQDAGAQARFIDSLVNRLAALGVSGVNIDFEMMSGADREAYSAFVATLSAKAKAKSLLVSIDLPRGSKAWNHRTAYDLEKLGAAVDYVMMMAYDQYWAGSDTPGSVSGLQWTEEGIQEFLSYGLPRHKLLLGIPFYVREWKLDRQGKLLSSRAVTMKELPALIRSTGAASQYDPDYGQTKYSYIKEGYRYVLWAETADTVKARMKLARDYGLAGIAIWRLGYEPQELWTQMLPLK